jgi:hypothetical protein
MTEESENAEYDELSVDEAFEALEWTPPFPLSIATWEAGLPVASMPVPGSVTIQVTGSTNIVT